MTLLEYVQSLQDQGATDIAAKVKKWKEENEYKAPEVSSEAKINPAAAQMGAAVAGKKMKASNKTFSDSVSIFGNGKSQYQEGDFSKNYKDTFGESIEDSNKRQKKREEYEAEIDKLSKVSNQGITHSANNYDYKWDIDDEGVLEYYTKPTGSEDWIDLVANSSSDDGSVALAAVQVELGHRDDYTVDELLEMNKKQEVSTQDFDPNREGTQSFDDMLIFNYAEQEMLRNMDIKDREVYIAEAKVRLDQIEFDEAMKDPDNKKLLDDLRSKRGNYEVEKAEIQKKIDSLPSGEISKLEEYEQELVDLEEKFSDAAILRDNSIRSVLDKRINEMQPEIQGLAYESAIIKEQEEPSLLNLAGDVLKKATGPSSLGNFVTKIVGDIASPVDEALIMQQEFYEEAKLKYAKKNGLDVSEVTNDQVRSLVEQKYIEYYTQKETEKIYTELADSDAPIFYGVKSLKDLFGDTSEEKNAKLTAVAEKLDVRKELLKVDLANKKLSLNVIESLGITTQTYKTEEEAEAAREKLRILNIDTKANYNIINNTYDGLSNKVKSSSDAELFSDLYSRNYGIVPRLAGSFASSGLDLFVNGVTEALTRYGITDVAMSVGNPFIAMPNLRAKLSGGKTFGRLGVDKFAGSVDELVTEINDQLALPKSFDELESGGDWARYLARTAGEQLPIYAVLATTGGAGLGIIGLATAGSKFREMQKEIDFFGAEYSSLQMYGAATLTGASAVATEYVTQGLLGRLRSSYKYSAGFKVGWKEGLRNIGSSIKKWGIDMAEEVPSEILDTIVGNVSDRYILGKKDVNIFDGVKETAFSTLWTAGIMMRAPLIGHQLAAPFRTKLSMQTIGENTLKIKDLSESLKNPDLSVQAAQNIQSEINTLVEANMQALKTDLARIDKLTDEEKSLLLTNKAKEYELVRSIEKTANDKTIDEKTRKILIQGYSNTLSELKNNSAKVLAPYILAENKEKNLPTIEKSIENVQKVTKETLGEDINVVDDMSKFTEETGQPAFVDAFVDPKTNKIYINKEWAASVGAVTAAEHELLHKIQKSLFDTNPTKAVEIVKDFQKTLSETELDLVQQRIDKNYRYELDSGGNLVLDKKGNKIEKPFEEYAEEYFNIFSDLVGKKEIGFTDNLGENLLRFLNKVKNKIFPPSAGFTNLEFKSGRDAYNFIKDYNKNIKKGKVSERASELIKKGAKTTSKQSKPSITKRAAEYVGLVKEGVLTNEDLVNIINSPSSKPNDKFGAIDAIVESNWPVISNAIKFNPTGSIPIEAVKTAVTEQMQGIFPGRKKELFKDFDASRDNKATTILGPKFLGMRQAEILERAKQIGGTTSEGTSTDSAQAKQIVDTSAKKSKASVKETKIAKKPTETTEFSRALLENVSFETQKELEDAISKAIEDAFKGQLITRFGQTRDIPKKVADIYGELFGINPQTITDKTRNYQNYDAAGLTTAKQFLLKNATQDFSRLPLTKDGFGKGTFLPRNVMKALYTDGVLTGGLKDYIELLRQKPVKPIYRDALGQTIRGLLNLHIRNRMFETLVPTTPKRIQGGAKFSVTSTGVEENKKQITKAQAAEALVFRGKNQELTMEKVQDLVSGKNWSELTRKEQVGQVVEAIKVLNEELGFNIATSVNLIERGDPDKAGSKKQLYITDLSATLNNKNISAKRKAEIQTQIENGELINLSTIKDKSKISLTNSDAARTQTTPTGKNKTKEQSVKSRIDINLSNIKNITKAKEDVFLNLLKVINKNPSLLGAINSLLYKVNNNAGAFRNLGTLIGMIQQKGYNQNITVGEHVLQYNEMINLLEVAGITMDPAGFKDMSKWLAESYIQVQSTNNTKADGKKIGSRSGSGIAIQENNYPAGSKNLFTNKNNLPAWNAKVSMLPELQQQIVEAVNGERAWKDVGSSLSKYFSSYGYYNANTFKIGDANGNLVPIADIWGVKVPKKYQATDSSGNSIFPDVVEKQAEILSQTLLKQITIAEGQKQVDAFISTLAQGKSMASKRDSDLIPDAIKYDRPITVQTAINALEKTDKSLELARKLDQPVKKIRVFDFDDTLARTKSNVLYTMPDGTTGKIDAATFAKEAGNMEAEGAQWDFSEFSKVMQGSKGPLLDVAKIIADKRGTKDVFVLTARPADAAGPIKEFLASMGLDIPLANITGLGDGAPEAKAGWIMGKAAEGYNDFYFADDHTGNVKAVKDVLSQIDVKSKVQLAKFSKTSTFNTIVNDMIEDSSGIETYKKYSAARAKTVGANKGKYAFLIPPSAEDFTGLLYKMIGKGKKGDAQMAFLKTNLLDTYNRAESAVTQAKISAANDFVALKTKLKTLPKTLSKETGIGKFTYSHAVRVAAWTRQGMTVPGLSKRDVKELNDFVNKDAKLTVFTDELIKIQKGKEYPKPGKDWLGGNITTDIIGGINKVNRAEYQQEWRENIEIIFSEDNMNKMEAAYGTRWREAMEDSIRRMKSGSNRPIGGNRVTEGLLNWLNNSVGAVMFLNTRSALLQTISAVNFINLGDNNIIKAGRAFANQKQFWGDFMTLMNSDYLVERRNGLKINVSESEIADAVRESKNKPKAAIAFLLSKGFVMTRFADSFAIASGGSTFYRNRLEALKKQGLSDADATQQAFEDFKAIAEENQQSSSPSKISQQQASAAGRVILAWANTPMQYARIQKRAAQDLINKRGDWKSNVSKIVYYGAIQNLIFNSLQQAVFALGFGDDEEETDEAKAQKRNDKAYKVVNGMIDSQLRGLGVFGTASVALKNTLMTLYEEHGKKSSKYENAIADLLSFSPPLGSKIGKITGGLRSASWNKKDMKEKGFSLDNPAYMAGAQVVTGLTNVPLDRVAKKINNLRGIVNERSALWQKVALGLGWSTWDVGLGYYGGFDKEKPLTPQQQLKLEVDTMKKDTNKPDQVKTLLDFGLTKKQIRELKNENNRVKKILELQKTKK